jgi:hypothetical protein
LSRHHCNQNSWIVWLIAVALITCRAQAQSIPSIWKTASDCEQYRTRITDAVKAKLAKLQSEDPETQKYARQWYIEQVTATQPPSASFMDVYADVINNALLNLLDPKNQPGGKPPSIRLRLNIAIINAAIAQRAGNARQSTLTYTLLRDPCEAVVLWGVKAAKFELMVQLAQPDVMRKPDLTRAIIEAVKTHPASGAIADEAFIALTLDVTDRDLRNTPETAVAGLIPQIIDLATFRVSQFGDSAPPNLFADGYAIVFLTRTKVWNLESPAQQQQVMDLLYNYLVATSKLFLDPAALNHDELLNLIRQVGRAFEAIAEVKADPALKKAAELVVSISADTKSDEMDARLSALKAAIH